MDKRMAVRAMVRFGRMRRCIYLVSGVAILAYVVFYGLEGHFHFDYSETFKTYFSHLFKNKDQTILRSKNCPQAGSISKLKINFKPEKIWIPDNYTGIPCNYTLELPLNKIKEKISSYEFPGIQEYIADLFPDSDNQTVPHEPVFVSALSSNHLREGRALISNFKKMANKDRKRKLIVYDIGLTGEENKQLAAFCECEVPVFPFGDYPDHIGILLGYAWKPIVIQLAARKYPFVVWLDSSIRFTTTNIDSLAEKGRKHGVVALASPFQLTYQTSIESFRFLNEPPCAYFGEHEPEAGFIVLYMSTFIKKYFMIPWVSCALVRDCMLTTGLVRKAWDCISSKDRHFHCHRFDQSVLGILMNRLFHKKVNEHYVRVKEYSYMCWDCFQM